MVVLKKIKGSTLMETLIATVLIMVIFVVTSLILNNLFSNSIKNNKRGISAKLNEIEYLYFNHEISAPYYDDYEQWYIRLETLKANDKIILTAEMLDKTRIIEKVLFKP